MEPVSTNTMSCSGMCSRFLWMVALLPQMAWASSQLTSDEAARSAFGTCAPKKENIFLDDKKMAAIQNLSGYEMPSKLVLRYVAKCGGETDGAAYVDVHQVRSKTETLLIVVDTADKIRRIEVLNFNEPPEHMPKEKWYGLFVGQSLSDELNLKKGIALVAGSTLTARATVGASRRVLALHQILNQSLKSGGAQ